MSDLGGPLPMAWVPPGVEVNNPEHWPLARGVVKHVGDPVAVVVGDDRYAVSDAVEDVIVEYEPLPAVIDPEVAVAGAPYVHDQFRPTRSTSGRWPAATSRPASPRPTSSWSGGSSTTASPGPRSNAAGCWPTTGPAR